jgi:hypothetical protein
MTEIVLAETVPGRYEVRLGDEVLVQSSRDPEHDAARVLLARGISGRMTTLKVDGTPRMHFDIARAAGLEAVEGANGPRIRPWRGAPSCPA